MKEQRSKSTPFMAPKGVPLLAAITALTCRLERGRSAGAAVGGGVPVGSAGCGSGAKGLLPGGATPRPSQVGDGMPLTKAAASSATSRSHEDHTKGESRCRPCAQSLPQHRPGEGPTQRLHVIKGVSSGEQGAGGRT